MTQLNSMPQKVCVFSGLSKMTLYNNILVNFTILVIFLTPGAAWSRGVVQDGLDKFYDHKRQMSALLMMRDLQSDGVVFEYYENGDIKQMAYYKNGQKHGIDKKFYHGGQLLYQREFRDGQQQGKIRQYYPNGCLWLEMNFVNDVPHGEARLFTEEGVLAQVTTYRVGKILTIKKYNPAGYLQEEEVF